MKKVFALAAISMISACGLLIDPDKLVEGNGSDPGTGDGATDTGNGNGDGGSGDAANDVATDGPVIIVEVPECVPPRPAAATGGPYAVVTALAGAPLACPAGYLAKPVAQGKGTLAADAVQCSDSSACTCAAGAGAPICGLKIRYYDDQACTKEADTPNTLTTSCLDLDSEEYGRIDLTVGGFTCSSTGPTTTTPTSKPVAAYKDDYVVCEPDPAVQTAQCKDGTVPVPAAKNASACVIVPTTQSCPLSYAGARDLSTTGTFNDGRSCKCECSNSPTSCNGGSITFFTGFSCSGTNTNVVPATCYKLKDANNDWAKVNNMPTPATATCAAKATASGTVTGATDLKLCCLSTGGGGN